MTSDKLLSNSLSNLYPHLAQEFNHVLNGITPDKVAGQSNKKMWWTCPKGHNYQAPISRRSASGSGCAYCANVKVLKGFNDLATAYPELAKQLDEDKSGFTAYEVMGKSSKRAWWKCAEEHSWEAVISSRANGRGCPSCSGWSVLPENSLAAMHSELILFFDTEKNSTDPFSIAPSSKKNVWWKCENSHSYQQMPLNKTRQNDGCPYCSGRYASPGNNLAEIHPELAKEFNAERNGFTAYDITPGSRKKVWWKCVLGHEWEVSPSSRNRTSGSNRITNKVMRSLKETDSGCPYCAGVSVLIGFNDLGTTNPELSKEMDVVKTGFSPQEVSHGTNRMAYWKCLAAHSWQASVSSRARQGNGCPECSNANSSQIEIAFRKALHKMNIWQIKDGSNTKLILTHNGKTKKMMVDIEGIFVDKKVVLEYDSYYYHSGRSSDTKEVCFLRDTLKTQILLDNGYHVVRIREKSVNGTLEFLDIAHEKLLQIQHVYAGQKLDHSESIKETIDQINSWIQKM